jgi:hypothetical protein
MFLLRILKLHGFHGPIAQVAGCVVVLLLVRI